MRNPTSARPRYIAMDLETALQAKWDAGKKEHRNGAKGFHGDPVEELFQEFLDAINSIIVLESQGVELPGYRTTCRNMALALQQRERELRRRI